MHFIVLIKLKNIIIKEGKLERAYFTKEWGFPTGCSVWMTFDPGFF